MDRGVFLIGLFKLIKAALLLTVAIGALSVLHKDVQEVVTYRIWQLGVDPENRFLHRFIVMLGVTSPHQVALVSAASFFYATLFGVEGVGLLMRKRWAEYLTVIVTASFLPLECYELARYFTRFKMLVVLLNIGIVIYLIVQLRKPRKQ
jgi:uncharacterized membrane protein (DUF2068 family)